MSDSNTQPLTEEQEPLQSITSDVPVEDQVWAEQMEKWKHAMKVWSLPTPHEHGPFTWLLNQNHNALRGCTTCGATWVGVMAGTEDSIRWHEVQEVPEDE